MFGNTSACFFFFCVDVVVDMINTLAHVLHFAFSFSRRRRGCISEDFFGDIIAVELGGRKKMQDISLASRGQ